MPLHRRLHHQSRRTCCSSQETIVACFSRRIRAPPPHAADAAASDASGSTDSDTDNLVKAIQSTLKSSFTSIDNLQKENHLQCQQRRCAANGDADVQRTPPQRPPIPSCSSQIQVQDAGCVLVDITSESWTRAARAVSSNEGPFENGGGGAPLLDIPVQVVDKVESMMLGAAAMPPAQEQQPLLENHLEGAVTAASTCQSWWDRPLWAWTWNELILAHGARIAQTMILEALAASPPPAYLGARGAAETTTTTAVVNVSSLSSSWSATVSNDKCLARLPSLYHQYCYATGENSNTADYERRRVVLPLVIDSVADDWVVRRMVKELCIVDDSKLLSDDLQHLHCLLERYSDVRQQVNVEAYRTEIDELIQSTTRDSNEHLVISDNNDAVQEQFEVTLTPSFEKRTNELSPKAGEATEVTPEAEQRVSVQPTVQSVTGEANKRGTQAIARKSSYPSKSTAPSTTRALSTSPQIDSRGVDIAMLSQLPPAVRSEARIAVAVRDNHSITNKIKQRGPTNTSKSKRVRRRRRSAGSLQTWFSRVGITNEKSDDAINAPPASSDSRKRRSRLWISQGDVDPATLQELPPEIQSMVESELAFARNRRPNRKRSGITSFFQSARTSKRLK